MKKLLLFLSIFTLWSGNAFAGSFPDVAEDHLNYEAIEFLEDRAVINGYGDGTFGADNLVQRSEAIKIIDEAFAVKKDGEYGEKFPDVTSTDWFFKYVMAGEAASIINGYDDGKFRPQEKVNMAETLKMVVLASGVDLPEVSENVFLDVSPEDWFAAHALYVRNKNIVLSDEYGNMHPGQAMSRAAFAEIIYRMLVVLEADGKPFPLDKNWAYYEGGGLPFRMKYNDKQWQITENKNEVVFLRPDKELVQSSAVRVYPNSAVVRAYLDENDFELSKNQYFNNVKKAFSDATQTEFQISGFSALEILYPKERIVDWYIYLDGFDVLVFYTEYGSGGIGYQLQQTIKAMLSTLAYKSVDKEPKKDYSAVLSNIFKNLLVEGKGQEMLDLIPDETIIETDAIGVGTGPVDYYYSVEMGYTFKYERSVDVILDTREGQTTAF